METPDLSPSKGSGPSSPSQQNKHALNPYCMQLQHTLISLVIKKPSSIFQPRGQGEKGMSFKGSAQSVTKLNPSYLGG
jgi:hypothetical protein